MTTGVNVEQAVKRSRRVDPAAVGRRVLASLSKGRLKAIEMNQARSRERANLLLPLATADVLAGRPPRGRAGRLARQLRREGNTLSERQVKRILDRLSSVSIGQE